MTFKIDRSDVSHVKQKEIYNKLVKEGALEFPDIKDKIGLNNLTCTFKPSRNKPKDFWNYQIPLKLFEE